MKHIAQAITSKLGSNKFFIGILLAFVFEALWIALSGRYPMAFDEDFHLGIIKIYAHHLSPFLAQQPPNADQYGAVFRDPSYLYQYLMSFPYRLISLFTNDQTIQVIILRFINIGLFAASLPLYRKVMRAVGVSKQLVNVLLSCIILVPVVPLMAAQINYDNLLLPLVALALLLSIRFAEGVKNHGRVSALLLSELLVVCLLASLVQYEFLPIFLAIVVYVGVVLYKRLHHAAKAWGAFRRSYHVLATGAKLTLLVVVLLSGVLFFQRYGVNAISYKTPIPSCSKVLNVSQCSAYGPWSRNYADAQNKGQVTRSPLVFSADWFYGMWLRSFFSVAGPGADFQSSGPLTIPGIGAIIFGGIGLILFVVYCKRIFRHYNRTVLWLLLSVSVIYVAALWLDNYSDFLQTGQAVAVNGRYLIPVALPLMLLFALGYAEFMRGRPRLKLTTAMVAMLCLLWGGGVFTWMIRSNDSWYWRNQAVFDVSHAAQKILDPVVPGSHDQAEFL